jgi:hypothetical protein
MLPAGFEPAAPASDRPQTHALERAATGIGFSLIFLAQQPPLGQGLLIREVSRSHTTTHHSR